MSAEAATEPNVLLTHEQEDLARMLSRAFGDWKRSEQEEGGGEPRYDAELWSSLGADLGLLGVDLPVDHGGEGFTAVELGLTMTEMGRVLLPSPYLSTVVLGAGLLMALGDESAMAAHLPALARGELKIAVAVDESGRGWSPVDVATSADPVDAGWRLNGVKRNVIDGAEADLLLVAARADAGVGVFAVEPGAPGLDRRPVDSVDATRALADLELDGTPAVAIGIVADGWLALDRLLDRLYACLACEQVGAARACLDLAVEYAKSRRQFNRPIGSFQAIKHACANLYVEIEAAESLARRAMACLAAGSPESKAAAALALASATEALDHASAANVQIHGGIGFTWEHPAHRYYRRSIASRVLFGSPRRYRMRAFECIEDGSNGGIS